MVFQRCWSLLCRVFLCFFRQTTLTGKCGKRARPDVLYEGSAEEEDDDDGDDGEAVKQLPFHVIMIVWVEMMLELFFLWMILELQRSWGWIAISVNKTFA